MSSREPTLSNTIHLRDFVDAVTNDPTRADTTSFVEIRSHVNVFEDRFYSPNIVVEPVQTRLRAYIAQADRDLYVPEAFIYVDGHFSTAITAENTLELTVHAMSMMRYFENPSRSDFGLTHPRHPGDVSDFDEYRKHLPEQWRPIMTMIKSVIARSDNDPSEPRCFELGTSVYDTSKVAPTQFSVDCFFENIKRWEKVRIPPSCTYVSVTAKVAGRTKSNHLALRVLDLSYLPRAAAATTTPDSTSIIPAKRSSRWDRRANPSTPSKKTRQLDTVDDHSRPAQLNIWILKLHQIPAV